MAVVLQQRVLVHRLEALPATVGFVLDLGQDVSILRLRQMARLAHLLEPVGYGTSAA